MSTGQIPDQCNIPDGVPASFPHYVPDSPSYAGRVDVRVRDHVCYTTTWARDGRPITTSAPIDPSVPDIAEALELTDERLERTFNALEAEARHDYLESSLTNLDRNRVNAIRFEDGVEGAVILWGECCFISVLRFAPSGSVEFSLVVS